MIGKQKTNKAYTSQFEKARRLLTIKEKYMYTNRLNVRHGESKKL